MILVDTNVLLRAAQVEHRAHAEATTALDALRRAGEELCVVPQVVYEYWVVCTRPLASNGLNLNAEEADSGVARLLLTVTLLNDQPALFEQWRRLARRRYIDIIVLSPSDLVEQ